MSACFLFFPFPFLPFFQNVQDFQRFLPAICCLRHWHTHHIFWVLLGWQGPLHTNEHIFYSIVTGFRQAPMTYYSDIYLVGRRGGQDTPKICKVSLPGFKLYRLESCHFYRRKWEFDPPQHRWVWGSMNDGYLKLPRRWKNIPGCSNHWTSRPNPKGHM